MPVKRGIYMTNVDVFRYFTCLSSIFHNIDLFVNYPIYKYEFQFFAKGKNRIANCKTYKSNLVEDEVEEFILYDYVSPDINIVYDAIPNAPEFDHLGQMQQIPLKKTYLLIVPILTLIVHITWAFLVLI